MDKKNLVCVKSDVLEIKYNKWERDSSGQMFLKLYQGKVGWKLKKKAIYLFFK